MPIKNYKAATVGLVKKNKSSLVRDYMVKDLIVFYPEQKLIHAVQYLIHHNISGGPVINEDKEVIGMITEADYMRYISSSCYYGRPVNGATVKDYMSVYVDALRPDDSVFYAADLFHTLKRKRLVVMERGKLVGQITRKEILKAVLG